MALRLTFLGTGTSVGVPQIGCTCPTCTSDDPRDRRRRTGLYVQTPGTAFVVDAPPEFRPWWTRRRSSVSRASS